MAANSLHLAFPTLSPVGVSGVVTGEKSSRDEEMLVGVIGQSLFGLGMPESVMEPEGAKEMMGSWRVYFSVLFLTFSLSPAVSPFVPLFDFSVYPCDVLSSSRSFFVSFILSFFLSLVLSFFLSFFFSFFFSFFLSFFLSFFFSFFLSCFFLHLHLLSSILFLSSAHVHAFFYKNLVYKNLSLDFSQKLGTN